MADMHDVRVDRRTFLRSGGVAGTSLLALGGTATATDSDGSRADSNGEPSVDFDLAPTPLVAGHPATFEATGVRAASEYDWTFADGATATGERVTRRFADGGSKTVTLTVTNDAGETDTVRRSITVYREVTVEIEGGDSEDRLLAVVRGESNFDPTAEVASESLRLGSPTALAMGSGATPVGTESRDGDLYAWFRASAADSEIRLGGRTTDGVPLLGLAD